MATNKRFGRWSYETLTVAQDMERFAVKRGLIKSMGGNAGLAKLATTYFENINVDADGVFTGSYGLLTSVQGSYDDSGKLAVDVVQLKGGDLAEFLDSDEGPAKAMESRKRWSGFLDEATGYNAKQRGDKAKEVGSRQQPDDQPAGRVPEGDHEREAGDECCGHGNACHQPFLTRPGRKRCGRTPSVR